MYSTDLQKVQWKMEHVASEVKEIDSFEKHLDFLKTKTEIINNNET